MEPYRQASFRRVDIPEKVSGPAIYAMDMDAECYWRAGDRLHLQLDAPVPTASTALKVPGVKKVVEVPVSGQALLVLADNLLRRDPGRAGKRAVWTITPPIN